jgi:hypothetical protein
MGLRKSLFRPPSSMWNENRLILLDLAHGIDTLIL